MDSTHEALVRKFYDAFARKDFSTMQSCYHPEARFSDPVFNDLSSPQVKAMWQMLLTSSKDLRIEFSAVSADGSKGSCHWEAWYTFSRSGRLVHNIIDASFEFRDGLIYRHQDHFNFYRWSRQALGLSGLLLGWTPIIQNKVRGTANNSLTKFMASLR